jgi:hypothetical protein
MDNRMRLWPDYAIYRSEALNRAAIGGVAAEGYRLPAFSVTQGGS